LIIIFVSPLSSNDLKYLYAIIGPTAFVMNVSFSFSSGLHVCVLNLSVKQAQ